MVDNARNPASVRFYLAAEMADHSYCFSFRAQNGFGGMGLDQMVVTPGDKGYERNDARTSPGFARAWNAHCAAKVGIGDATELLNSYARNFSGQE
ncbi:MAG: hypothetical protein WA185_05700 [Candidatus Acidiferrales bacterium]